MKRHIFTVSILLVAAQLFGQESRFWVNGSGKWTDESHWSAQSGGEPGATVPDKSTKVVFDNNSFGGDKSTVTMGEGVTVAGFEAAGASFVVSGKSDLVVSGSISVDASVDFGKLRGALVLDGKGSHTVNLPVELSSDVVIASGDWTLKSDLKTEGNITLKGGSLSTDGYRMECAEFTATEDAVKLDLKNSTVTCDKWDAGSASNLTLKAEESQLEFRHGLVGNFFSAPKNYGKVVNLENAGKAGKISSLMLDDASCPSNATEDSKKKDGRIQLTTNDGSTKIGYGFVTEVSKEGGSTFVDGNGSNVIIVTDKPNSYWFYTYKGTKPTNSEINAGQEIAIKGTETFDNARIKIPDDGGATCFEGDIKLAFELTGGSGSYTATWEPAGGGTVDDVNADVVTATANGTYSLSVSDGNGCVYEVGSFKYNPKFRERGFPDDYPDGPSRLKAGNVEGIPTCGDDNCGEIKIEGAQGGALNRSQYTFQISKGSDTYSPSTPSTEGGAVDYTTTLGLSAGNYKVKIVDNKGCESQEYSATISTDDKPEITVHEDSYECWTGTNITSYTVTGIEVDDYDEITYSVSGPAVLESGNNTVAPKLTITGFGKVEVSINAKKGNCLADSKTKNIYVQSNVKPTITLSKSDICVEGGATVSVSGNEGTITWKGTGLSFGDNNSPSTTVTASVAGNYNVYIEDNRHGCIVASEESPLNVHAKPTLSLSGSTKICKEEDVNLSVEITATATDYSTLVWSVKTGEGDPSLLTPSGESASYLLNSDGVDRVTVKATVTSDYCEVPASVSPQEHTFLVFPSPKMKVSAAQICGPSGSVSVSDVADNNVVDWTLPAGVEFDGEPSHTATANIKLAEGAEYKTYTLTVKETNGADCSKELTMPVTFVHLPVITVENENPEVCGGNEVEVSVTSYLYCENIDFQSSAPADVTPVPGEDKVTYHSSKSLEDKKVYVWITPYNPDGGCPAGAPKTVTITVKAMPEPKLFNATSCGMDYPLPEASTVKSVANSRLIWEPADGETDVEIVEGTTFHANSSEDVVVKKLKVTEITNTCSSDPKIVNITFVAKPEVDLGSYESICISETNKPFALTNTVKIEHCSKFEWIDAQNTVFATDVEKPNYTFSDEDRSAKKAVLTLKAYPNVGCDDTIRQTVTINIDTLPIPKVYGNKTPCLGVAETYTTEPGMSGYQWSVDGAPVSGATSASFEYTWTTAGSGHSIGVTYNNSKGCSAAAPTTESVEVMTQPTSVLSDNAVFNTCTNGSVFLTATASGNGPFTYTWSDTKYSGAAPEFTSNTVGEYSLTCTITDKYGCKIDRSLKVVVGESPIITMAEYKPVCYGDTVFLNGSTVSSYSDILWDVIDTGKDGEIKNETSLTDAYYVPGSADRERGFVTVQLTASNGSCDPSVDYAVITLLPEFKASIGGLSPFPIDSTTTKISVRVKGHYDQAFGLCFYLVAPDGKELKLFATKDHGSPSSLWANYAGDFDFTFSNNVSNSLYSEFEADKWDGYQAVDGTYAIEGWYNQIEGKNPAEGGWAVKVGSTFGDGEGELVHAVIKFTDINDKGKEQTIVFDSKEMQPALSILNHQTRNYAPPIGLSVSCFGECDAHAMVSAYGGTFNYTKFEWAKDAKFTNIVLEGQDEAFLCAGKYYARVTDDNGCYNIDSVEVTQPDKIVFTKDLHEDVACYGESTGKLQVSIASGGEAPITFQWVDSLTNEEVATTALAENLYAGKFTVIATDDMQCQSDTTFEITQKSQIVVESVTVVPTCGNAGEATFVIEEGTGTPGVAPAPAYTLSYRIGENGTPKDVVGMTAKGLPMSDSLIFTITDGAGCTIERTISTVPAEMSLSTAELHAINCFGDTTSVKVSVTPGDGTFIYAWQDAQNNSVGGNASVINGIKSGVYSVIVTDAYGCEAYDTIEVGQPTKIQASINYTAPLCYGSDNASLKASATGGNGSTYTYNWYEADGTLKTAGAELTGVDLGGIYIIGVSDGFCENEIYDTITIANPAELTVSAQWVADNSSCDATAGSAKVSAVSGGLAPYSYEWYSLSGELVADDNDGNDAIATNLGVGFYIVAVTDSLGCEAESADTIEIKGGGNIDFKLYQAGVTCQTTPNGEARVYDVTSNGAAASNVQIFWNNSSVSVAQTDTVKTLAFGLNQFFIRTNEGCRAGKVSIDDSRALRISDDIDVTPIVHDGCEGAFVATIEGGSAPFKYTLKDENGATVVAETTINSNKVDVKNLCEGTYTLQVDIAAGSSCPAQATIEIKSSELTYNTTKDPSYGVTDVTCKGDNTGAITGIAEGGYADAYNYEWRSSLWGEDSVRTTASISGLAAGSYTVKVSQYHVEGTQKDTLTYEKTFEVKEPNFKFEVLADSIHTEGSHCYDAIGSITIGENADAFHGVAPFSYSLDGAAVSMPAISLASGSYELRIADARGCADTLEVEVDDLTGFYVSVVSDSTKNPLCYDDANGSIQISAISDNGVKKFSWTKDGSSISDSTATLKGIKAGTYVVTVEDSTGCTKSETITLNQPAKVQPIITIDRGYCSAADVLTYRVSSTGGSGEYSYAWVDKESDNTIFSDSVWSNPTEGLYLVKVSDVNSCPGVDSVEIKYPTLLTVSVATTVSLCEASTGTATATVSGGMQPYSYNWHTIFSEDAVAADNSVATGLGVDFYVVEVTDFLGCSVVDTFEIVDEGNMLVRHKVLNDVLCECDGEAKVLAAFRRDASDVIMKQYNPDSLYFVWNGVDTLKQDSVYNKLCVGLNKVLAVSNYDGCRRLVTINMSDESALRIANVARYPDLNGAPSHNGMIIATIAGGVPGYSYLWTKDNDTIPSIDTDNTTRIEDLAEGTYVLHVTDQNPNGCTKTDTITIDYRPMTFDTVQYVAVSCYGTSTGMLEITGVGGYYDDPYVYEWTSPQWPADSVATTAAISNLKAGVYNFTIRQLYNDVVQPCVGSIEVTQPANRLHIPEINAITEGSHCYDSIGVIEIFEPANLDEAFGGYAPFTYTFSFSGWANDTTLTSGTQPKLTGLASGNYGLHVEDAVGCSFDTTIVVEDLSKFVVKVDNVTPARCYDETGSIKISASSVIVGDSFHYQWSCDDTTAVLDTTPSLDNIKAGIYVVTVTNDSACVRTETIELEQPDKVEAKFTADLKYCTEGETSTFYVNATGGWGSYVYTLCDTLGTVISRDSVLTNPEEGLYIVKVLDRNGCRAQDTLIVKYPEPMEIVSIDTTISECGIPTGTATVNMKGGVAPYNFYWHTIFSADTVAANSNAVDSLGVDIYVVEITDMSGCSVSDTIEIIDEGNMDVRTKVIKDVICQCDGEATAIGAYRRDVAGQIVRQYNNDSLLFIWNNSVDTLKIDSIASGLCVGNNRLLAISMSDGCRRIKNVEMSDESALRIANVARYPDLNGAPSHNGMIIATVAGGVPGYTYLWTCAGDTIKSNDTENTTTIEDLAEGTYVLTVTDENPNGCTIVDSFRIDYRPLTFDTVTYKAVTCFEGENGELEITGVGGYYDDPYVYEWRSSVWGEDSVRTTAAITDLTAGVYYFTVRQKNNDVVQPCIDSIVVTQPTIRLQIPELNLITEGSHCYDSIGNIEIFEPANVEEVFGGNAPFIYNFSNSNWAEPVVKEPGDYPKVANLPVDNFKLHVVDRLGCEYDTTVMIEDLSRFTVKLENTTPPRCYGQTGSITIKASSLNGTNFKYEWSCEDTTAVLDSTPTLGNIKAGFYVVTVTDDSSCVKVDTVELTQPDKITFAVSNTVANSCYNLADGTVTFDSLQGGRGIYDLFRFFDAETNAEVAKFNVKADSTFGSFDSEKNAEIANFKVTVDTTNAISFEKVLKAGDYKVRVSDNSQQCHSDTVEFRVYSKRPEIKFNTITDDKLPECLRFDKNGNPSNDGQFTVNMFAPAMSAFVLPDSTASLKLFYSLDGSQADSNNVFKQLTAGEHTITVGYDSMICAIDTVHELKSKSSFEITEAGFYQNGTNSPAIFTCPDNELSAFVSASGNFSYSFYTPYIEEPVEETVVPVDTVKADSAVAYGSRLRKFRFYADSVPTDSVATELPVEEVKKPAYKKLETINGVVYAVFEDSTATNKGWSYFMPYGGETYYFVSVSDGHCMDIDSIKATSMKPVNKLNAHLVDDGSYKFINGRYEVAEGALVQFEANTPEFEFGDGQLVFSESFWTWKQIGGDNGSALKPELDSIGRGNPMTAKTYGELKVEARDTIEFIAHDEYNGIYTIDTTFSCVYTGTLAINSINGIKPMEVFTPNGDEYNETWGVNGLSSYANVTIYVFNRWGGRVWQYSGSGPDYETHQWDGRNAKNKPLPSGTYYYVIQCSDDVLVGKKVTGPVTIIR